MLLVIALASAIAAVELVPCQQCIETSCSPAHYVDYNADGMGARCNDLHESSLYDCYLRNPLRVCLHSTLNTTVITTLSEYSGLTTQIADVAPFTADPGSGFITKVRGSLSVERPTSSFVREVVLHLVDLHTKRSVNEMHEVRGSPGEIDRIHYEIDFRNKGHKTDLYLFVFIHDIELATKRHAFYTVNPAIQGADNCTNSMRTNYAETFVEACYPQVTDITTQRNLKYEYVLTSRGRVADLYLTSIPAVTPVFSVEYPTKNRDTLVYATLGVLAFAFLLGHCADKAQGGADRDSRYYNTKVIMESLPSF
jgi:hypothetical protein